MIESVSAARLALVAARPQAVSDRYISLADQCRLSMLSEWPSRCRIPVKNQPLRACGLKQISVIRMWYSA